MAVSVPCWRNTSTRKPTVWATLSRSLGQVVRGAITAQSNGMLAVAWTSPVENFVKGLVTGAAVIGVERTAALVAGWAKGHPVKFQTFALLNGGSLSRALSPVEGVEIGLLPLTIEALPICLRASDEVTPQQFLRQLAVSIDTTVAPPLFRLDRDHLRRNVHAAAASDLDVTSVCQALSLVANGYFDAGFCWHDYGELSLFSLNSADTYWPVGPVGPRNRPYASISLNRSPSHGRHHARHGEPSLARPGERRTRRDAQHPGCLPSREIAFASIWRDLEMDEIQRSLRESGRPVY